MWIDSDDLIKLGTIGDYELIDILIQPGQLRAYEVIIVHEIIF